MIETEALEVAPSRTDNVDPEVKLSKITFVAYRPRTQMPIVIRPCNDKTGKLYTGQGEHGYYETLTEAERKSLPVVFDHNTSFTVSDGKVLDLNDPHDAAMWKWIKVHPYITTDKDKGGRDAVFYVANPVKEATERVDKTLKVDEARYKVRQMSYEDHIAAALVLGLPAPQTFQPKQLLDWMLMKATGSPEAVLGAIDPSRKGYNKATTFFNDAIRWKVIERIDGSYFYGGKDGISLGHTQDMVVDYLLAPENVERTKAMRTMLMEKTKVAN